MIGGRCRCFSSVVCVCVRQPDAPAALSGPLLLLLVEGPQRDVRDLDDLEADTRNVADGVALTAEAGYEHLVVLLHVVQAAVARHERRDLLAVLDELHAHALADGRVRLFGLDAYLLEHDALGVGGARERVRLPARAQM